MELTKENWQKKDYQEYLKYLESLSDEKNKAFTLKLTPTKYEVLGIKLPVMRDIAKKINKGNKIEFIKQNTYHYYEEIMILGFVIATTINYQNIDEFIKYIDNWAICDSFSNTLKKQKYNRDELFNYANNLIKSKEEFICRVGLIILLNNFIDKEHINLIYKEIEKIKSDKYYINMAIAWFIAEGYIKEKEVTLKYLLKTKLDKFTFNKAISKIHDSYRVSKEEKEYLNTLRK